MSAARTNAEERAAMLRDLKILGMIKAGQRLRLSKGRLEIDDMWWPAQPVLRTARGDGRSPFIVHFTQLLERAYFWGHTWVRALERLGPDDRSRATIAESLADLRAHMEAAAKGVRGQRDSTYKGDTSFAADINVLLDNVDRFTRTTPAAASSTSSMVASAATMLEGVGGVV